MARVIGFGPHDDPGMKRRLLHPWAARSGFEETGASTLPLRPAEPLVPDELVASPSEADAEEAESGLLERISAYSFGPAFHTAVALSGRPSSV